MDTINQVLEEAQKDPKNLLKHKDNSYLRAFLEAAFYPEKKFNLPEGVPPYKKNEQHEEQLRGSFWQIARKIEIFQRKDIRPFRQEILFVQALESLPDVEAKILLAAKDQKLGKLYKGLSLKKLEEIGFF